MASGCTRPARSRAAVTRRTAGRNKHPARDSNVYESPVVSFSVVGWCKLGLRQLLDHRGLTMRKRSLLFLSLLVPAFLVLGGYAVLKAQQKTSSTASGKRWSDAATLSDKK